MGESDYFCPHCNTEIIELHDVMAASDMMEQEIERLRDWQRRAVVYIKEDAEELCFHHDHQEPDCSCDKCLLNNLVKEAEGE